MYQFPEEIRRAYEAQPAAFVYDQLIDGKVVPLLVSDGFCELVGMDRDQALEWFLDGQFERLHPDDVGYVARVSEEFAAHRSAYDLVFRTKHDDGYHVIHAVGRWQTMEDGTELALLTYEDMTDNYDVLSGTVEEYRLFRSDHFFADALTGLPNLNYLNQFADQRIHTLQIQKQTPVLLYVNVVSMQYYNNQYGYQKGNELLCLVAETLKEVFPDALLLRGADDHFVLIDSFVDEESTEAKIKAADSMIQQQAEGKRTGIRAGVCVYTDDLQAIDLMDRARNAIRWSGNDLNRLCHFYTREANQKFWNQRYVLENFDKALENGWLKVYYQGIVRTETGKGAAQEALARWEDPERGLLSPGVFIPVLEQYHLLHKLDLFMAEQVCRDMPLRKEHGLPLVPVTVNFSAQDFDYADIPTRLNQIYNQYCPDLSPDKKYLIVEITEQDMAQATDRFHEQLQQLRDFGFRIWLDDFGSGYSSLNVFGRFGVDLIKFDMELLQNLDDHNGANRRIMNSMVQIAREMGIHTLAEGTETEQQRDFLQEIGCELAQGFLFYKPEPLVAALDRVGAGQKPQPCETDEERETLNQKWIEEHEQSLAVIEQLGDHMPGGFFICRANEQGNLIYANKAAWHIHGCETLEEFKEFTGFSLRGMLQPEEYDAVLSIARTDLEKGRTESEYAEFRINHRSGELRWVGAYNYYVKSSLHQYLYYVFISDITEKRQAEEAEKAMRSSVIEALTRVYDSVWIINDIKTQSFELFRVDEGMAHLMPAHEAVKLTRFSDALAFYSRLVLEEDRKWFLEATAPEEIDANTKDKPIYSVPFRRVFEAGVRYYRLEFARMELANGEVNIVAGFKDVDEEVRKDQAIRHSLDLHSAVIESLTQVYDSVWLVTDLKTQAFELFRVDEELAHLMPAQAASKLTRFTDALAFYSQLVLDEDRQAFLEATSPENIEKNTKDSVLYSVPFRRVFKTGTRYYRLEFAKLKLESGKTGIVAGFKDVDDVVRKDLKLSQDLREAIDLSETDRMTGIYNRISGELRVDDLLSKGRGGMFVLFDIDHFKLYNDRFGHTVGDQVIITAANCLKNAFRGEDVVIRLGGDEFGAFAAGVESKETGERILQRFYDSLNNAVIREGVEEISVSAGVAFIPEQPKVSFTQLYDIADQAMYESKRAADGEVTFRVVTPE